MSWSADSPPLYLTPVPDADIERGDGDAVIETIETLCVVTKDGFAAQAGEPIVLRPWQRELVKHLFARRSDGRLRHRVALIGMPRKNGKLLHVDTPLLTGDGWKTMGTVTTGDHVHTLDGSLTRVTATSEVVDDEDCYEIMFSDGSTVIAGARHEWAVNDKWATVRNEGWRTLETAYMAERYLVGPRLERRYSVRMDRILVRDDVKLPIDPYVLGYWLGDGSAESANFTVACADLPHLQAQVTRAGYHFGDSHLNKRETAGAVTVSTTPVRRGARDCLSLRLRQLGVLGAKHVPQEFLLASARQRLALLQGLMDSDGTISPSRHPRVEFNNTNKDLAEAVLFLARSLGWKASFKTNVAKYNGKVTGPVYDVAWTAYREFSPFRQERKTRRLSALPTDATRASTNQIVNIVPVPRISMRCIEVADPSHQYLVGHGLIPTHNSALGSGLALDGLLFGGQGAEVYSAAAEKEQARIVFGEAKRQIERNPDLRAATTIMKDVVEVSTTNSIYRCLSAEAYCVTRGTQIDLPDGSRAKAENLTVGDGIIGVDGIELVPDTVESQGVRDSSACLTVRTHRGREVTTTVDHPFLVRRRDYRRPDWYEWKRADELTTDDRVVVGMGFSDNTGQAFAPNEAWALGAFVGDGCNTNFRFTNIDAEIIAGMKDFLMSIGSDLKKGYKHQWDVMGAGKRVQSPGREWIRQHLGEVTARDKIVPLAVMMGTRDDWCAFLAGLFDTDGTASKQRAYINWTSASRSLLADCQTLLARLGINGSLGEVRVPYQNEIRVYYQLRVNGAAQLNQLAKLLPLRHAVKRETVASWPEPVDFNFHAYDSDRVVAVEDAGEQETIRLGVTRTSAHVTNGLVTHNSKEGLNISRCIYDELHAQPNDDLWNVLTLASAARKDPLVVAITTAGVMSDSTGRDSVCYRLFRYGVDIAENRADDSSFFMAWWGAAQDSDHTDPEVWRQANPGYGDLIDPEDFESAVKRTPEAEYRAKRLNLWVAAAEAWFPYGVFEAAVDRGRKLKKGDEVILGVDASYDEDATAVVLATVGPEPFVDVVQVWERPEGAGDEWTVPITEVEDEIRKACHFYKVREIACDPARWARSMEVLADERLPVVAFPQSSMRMVPATARFFTGISEKKISHSGNEVLVRHVANAHTKLTSAGLKVQKESVSSSRKIDAAIAAVMAVSRAQEVKKRSVRVVNLAEALANSTS